ncbi:MAG: hypothetical protein JWR19_3872 [Pedosphaera sp.]|nr:hypothetical protein [Pedosphaera sp.]
MFHLSVEWLAVVPTFTPLFSPAVWLVRNNCSWEQCWLRLNAPSVPYCGCWGLARHPRFQNYHRVLNRAVWSARQGAQLLLGLLVKTFSPTGPLVFGLDETIERRWGQQISARGI